MGLPVLNIGTRQSGRDRSENIIDCSFNKQEIKDKIIYQIKHGKYPPTNLYGKGDAAKRIALILSKSYIDYSKKMTY